VVGLQHQLCGPLTFFHPLSPLQAAWQQFLPFAQQGWTIHVVYSKHAADILVDACKAKKLNTTSWQVTLPNLLCRQLRTEHTH
jgi:hypothetical protein